MEEEKENPDIRHLILLHKSCTIDIAGRGRGEKRKEINLDNSLAEPGNETIFVQIPSHCNEGSEPCEGIPGNSLS